MKTEKVLELRQPDYDEIFDYESWHGAPAYCGVKIWTDGPCGGAAPTRYIVVMTELDDNPGMSVTNAAEIIATDVLNILLPGVDPEAMTWIEHYPPRGDAHSLRLPETYDLVRMRYDGRQFKMDNRNGHPWKRLTEIDLKDLGLLR